MKFGVTLLLVAACYSAHPQTGSPCDSSPCPSGLVCSPATLTCELTASEIDASGGSDAAPLQQIDAPLPPVNDTAAGAIDVSGGGTFDVDLTYANDDAPNIGCGGDGGADVFYEITLPFQQVVYFDTFGSNFETELRIYPGKACTAIAGMPICNRDQCGGNKSQTANNLPAGTSCIVVDQKAGEMNAALELVVRRGDRGATRLATGMSTITDDTCNGANQSNPPGNCVNNSDTNTAKDLAYYFTACPNQTLHLDASTCADSTQTHFDTELYVKPAGMPSIACNDDNNTCVARTERPDVADGSILTGVGATGPNVFFLVVDGYDGACGGFQLVTNLQ